MLRHDDRRRDVVNDMVNLVSGTRRALALGTWKNEGFGTRTGPLRPVTKRTGRNLPQTNQIVTDVPSNDRRLKPANDSG